MSLSDMAYLAEHPGFRLRVKVGMFTAAIAVGNEAPGPDAEITRLRRAHSQNVLAKPEEWLPSYAWGVAANPAVTYTSSDSDIQYTINTIFSAMAGAGPN